MKFSKLKNLKDNQPFYLSQSKKAVSYTLLSLDRKNKKATYQTEISKRTFTRKWDLACLVFIK